MTLCMLEACEQPAVGATKPWVVVGSGPNADPSSARTGVNGWGFIGGNTISYVLPAADEHTTMIAGVAAKWGPGVTGITPALQTMIEFRTPADVGILRLSALRVSGDPVGGLRLRVTRISDGVILGETAAVIDAAAFYYIEFKMVMHATTGSFEVRTDEVSRISGSNLNTMPASGTTCRRLLFTGAAQPGLWYGDDIYLCNGAGTVNNDFLGDTTVHLLYPTAAGDSTLFMSSDALKANWENVDDYATTTDYNEANVASLTDLYNFADLPAAQAGRTVFGVLSWGLLHSTSLPRGGALLSKLGATEAQGATIALSTTATGYMHRQELDPAGVAWTTGNVNAAQHGVRVVS